MKNLAAYTQSLAYEYVRSYSGLRGRKFESLLARNSLEVERIEHEIKTARYIQVPKLRKQIELLKEETDIYKARVVSDGGIPHESAGLVGEWRKHDDFFSDIHHILMQPLHEQFATMCAPVFRDALVFYSKEGEVQGVLHVCFGCLWMKNEKEEDIAADVEVFDHLKQRLMDAGHPIIEAY